MEKTWTDQPDVVMGGELLFSASLGKRAIVVEVRRERTEPHEPHRYLVSLGNLFGSQTLRVHHADDAFRLLNSISKATKPGLTVPPYAELVS